MAFRARLKVRFGDIDRAGIVYYPRFVHYFHVALEEFFGQELGVDYATVVQKHRLGFPTVHLEADFRHPLEYGDHIDVEVRVLKLGSTSITWGYTVYRAGVGTGMVVEGHNVTVCVNLDTFEKAPLPSRLKERLEAYRRRCREESEAVS